LYVLLPREWTLFLGDLFGFLEIQLWTLYGPILMWVLTSGISGIVVKWYD